MALVKTPAWQHQAEALAWIEQREGSLIAVGMGGGKTMIGTMAIAHMLAMTTLILCPTRITAVWRREIYRHMPTAPHLLCILERKHNGKEKRVVGNQAARLAAARRVPLIITVNYEAAWREPLRSWLLKLKPDLLILDECHRIKAPGGRASLFCALLARRCRKRVGLTGTPMPHSPLDLYGQLRTIDQRVFGTSWVGFRGRYATIGGASGTEILNYQNEAELWAKFHGIAFVRAAEECTDLPELTEQTIPIQLSPQAMLVYRKLEAHFWADVGAGTVTLGNALGRLVRLQQVTSGYLPLDLEPRDHGKTRLETVDTGKAEALTDLLDDVPPSEPVVVFCRFHHDLDRVQQIAEQRGLRYGEVSGRRTDLTADATMPEGVDLMAVQVQSGGVGIDLTRAKIGVFFSVGFSLGDLQQCKARLHRSNQERHVTLIHLVAEGTVDEIIREALENNLQIIETIMARGPEAYAALIQKRGGALP